MLRRRPAGTIYRIIMDQFRFDSFKVGDDGDYQSKLLSRFGATVFLFLLLRHLHKQSNEPGSVP